MWQTIQLLLGPDEHSSFLMEAVQKWDVKDPTTGQVFPKLLPRQCFPAEPDKHMVAWYEGVSDRLRREAEDEERQRQIESEQVDVRRLPDRTRRDEADTDDSASVDSRAPALAYFKNPLYRHIDGRPSIIRNNSKRPGLSPRPTMMDKGKEAASTMGHVIRNIGSPHLWSGRGEATSDSRERRRRSLPDDRRHTPGDRPTSSGYDSKLSPDYHPRTGSRSRRSSQVGPPEVPPGMEDETLPYSPRPSPGHRHHHYRDDYDPTLRRHRSHEPTPSQKEYTDYFQGYDDPAQRRNSSHTDNAAVASPNGVGPSFAPSASPLFASHIAKQPVPSRPRPPPPEHYNSPVPRKGSVRRASRPYSHSRSPDPSMLPQDREQGERSHASRERHPRFEASPRPGYDDRGPHPPRSVPPPTDYDYPPSESRPHSEAPYPHSRERRSHRHSGSDLGRYNSVDDRDRDGRRGSKQTRFAAGVDGRRYPNETPWR